MTEDIVTTTETGVRDVRGRVLAVLEGRKPDRIPFIDRMELWYAHHVHKQTLPEPFRGMSLNEVHHAVGLGRQKFMPLFEVKLRGVELVLSREGQEIYHEVDPIVDYFPRLYGILPSDQAGVVTTDIITPRGRLRAQQELLPNMIEAGMGPYMFEHPIKSPADYPIFEYILERAEYVPADVKLEAMQDQIGSIGFVVPMLDRTPFQQVLLDFVGETPLFYLLYDEPRFVEKMVALLDERVLDKLRQAEELPVPYIEFSDNLEAQMTNPRLFETWCLPYYQRYADVVHGQGKKMGSHTDGNLLPLLHLLAETGLDVCESFSPAPLTQCTFDDAWQAWESRERPIIWGGIPSLVLDPETPEAGFEAYVDHVLETVADRPIILGVGDMVVPGNLVERVQYIADRIETL